MSGSGIDLEIEFLRLDRLDIAHLGLLGLRPAERDTRRRADIVDDVVDVRGACAADASATSTVRLRISSERAHMSLE